MLSYKWKFIVLCWGPKTNVTILVLDLVMVALLFSNSGAAAAIGAVGYKVAAPAGPTNDFLTQHKENEPAKWEKICDMLEKYCHFTTASIVLSLLGALIFLILVVLTALHLNKRRNL
ncbi:CASP-like protein 1E1 [Telopea speciosissima]|uniref:CASP-like protein 1E1 n=1 Tax=Telopea speciosissima TaxID=54955 RepID=UPI001CC498ED|nr:CASP-like protein 1E1 [Telopea speciosissima]